MLHGFFVIIVSILYLTTLLPNFTFILVSKEFILMTLVALSILVILETFYIIHLSLWRDFPRDWQKKACSGETASEILKGMKDRGIYKDCNEIINDEK